MQVDGALQGGSTIPRRRRLNVVLAIVVIAAMVALLVWASAFATRGAGTEDARMISAWGQAPPFPTTTRVMCTTVA
jgi:hypothetical protein